ncbi:hypothetical protein [Streptomyces sp. NPDC002851]
MICSRCERVIMPGEAYDTHVHDRASAAPLVIYSHKGLCPLAKTPEPSSDTAGLGKDGRRRRAT